MSDKKELTAKDWLDEMGYYNSGLRTDKHHRIDLYLSDVLDEYHQAKLAETNQRHEEQMKERVIKSLLSFAHSGQLPDTFCYTDEEILTGLEKWYNEKYGSDE